MQAVTEGDGVSREHLHWQHFLHSVTTAQEGCLLSYEHRRPVSELWLLVNTMKNFIFSMYC